MKQKFTFKTILSTVVAAAIFSSAVAQTSEPVSVSWSLATDSSVTTLTGNVTASVQTVSPFLAPKRYRTISSDPGWQGKGEGQIYPAAYDPTIYDEYKIKPTAGNALRITQISFRALGGGTGNMRLAVYYSKDGFASFDSLGGATSLSGGSGATYNGTTYRATAVQPIALLNTSTTGLGTIDMATFPGLNININAGDSFIVRTYPFLSAASTSTRYYPSKEWMITGSTTSVVTPVSFAGIRAFQKSGGVQVEWTSATEVNVSKYAIEKSTDGRTFREVGTVAATANRAALKSYSFYDATPVQGNNYYRVKGLDRDGSGKYTGIMKVSIGRGAAGFLVSPNPVRGNVLNLQLSNIEKGTYNVQLFNGAGQKVFAGQVVHLGGSATEVMQIPSLQKGMYNLQFNNGTTRFTKSVIVE